MTATLGTHRGEVPAASRADWLLDAAAWLRVLDGVALAGRRVAIIDKSLLPGAAGMRADAFTSPAGIYDLVAPFLPCSRLLPGPVVFIDTATIANAVAEREPADAVHAGRLIANAIAVHEYAHVIDYQARGVQLRADTTLDRIFAADVTPPQTRVTHGACWLRAYCHLLCRSMATPAHRDFYLDFARVDVAGYGLGELDDYFATLDDEVADVGLDGPLIDIVRSPAPAAFVKLFNQRDAARSASEGEIHATA